MRKIINLILLSIIVTTCLAQQTELRLNLKEGEEYKQITDMKSTISEDVNGQKINMVMGIAGSMTYLVKSVNENNYDMEVKYDSLSMSIQSQQITVNFSSEKKDEKDIMSQVLASMKNVPFKITMTTRGKITDVKDIDLLFESAFDKFSEMTEAQMAQIKAQLTQAYGSNAFKGNIEMTTAIYPDKSVAIGDRWEINTKLEAGMAADITTTYMFAESNSDYNLIVGDSKFVTANKDAYVEANGMPLRYDMKGNVSSEIKVDKITGWIIEAKINQDINGDAYIKSNPQMPEGMKIPMVMKNEMKFYN